MPELLFGYGLRLFEALVILLFIVVTGAISYRVMWQRWQAGENRLVTELKEAQRRVEVLEQELNETQKRYDPTYWRALHNHLHHAVGHEFGKRLHWIAVKSSEVMNGLRPDQVDLGEKQSLIAAQAYELLRHAENIVGLFALEPEPERELVNLQGLIDGVLKDLFPFAEAQHVTLRRELLAFEPVPGNRYLMSQIFANVIHNAIKYSTPGGVVEVKMGRQDEAIWVDVRDRGRGIEEQDKARIFELQTRGDGLVQPGSGLGLYYARELVRLHGGDLVLVQSLVNQGSTFRILLPYHSGM